MSKTISLEGYLNIELSGRELGVVTHYTSAGE